MLSLLIACGCGVVATVNTATSAANTASNNHEVFIAYKAANLLVFTYSRSSVSAAVAVATDSELSTATTCQLLIAFCIRPHMLIHADVVLYAVCAMLMRCGVQSLFAPF